MSTNRHTPTGLEILMIAQANPDISIPSAKPQHNFSIRQPKQRLDIEHQEQVKLFAWAEQNLDKWNGVLKYMFAIPNGGKRTKATAGRLKAEGVKAGVPDIFLPVPVYPYFGRWIEMKARGGRLQASQDVWLNGLREQGYRTAVCYSAGEASGWITLYLDGKLPLDIS